MNLYSKYMKFLNETTIDEDLRSGQKELSKIDLSQFNFGAEYEFTAPYDKFSEAPIKSINKINDILEKNLNISIQSRDKYVSQNAAKSEYRLTYDDSVKSDKFNDYNSLEFVTPILSYNKFISLTKEFFNLIEQYGWETSSSSGLHVGISFKDEQKNQNLDPLKLLVFSGDEFMKLTWPRIRQKLKNGELSQDYVKSNINTIKLIVKRVIYYSSNIEKITSNNIGELFTKWLDSHSRSVFQKDPEWRNKHFAVNIGRLKDGYVEFRVMGGKNYHKRLPEIEKQVKRFCLSMIQTSSEETKKDYLKKLYKLLNQVLNDLESYGDMHSGIDVHTPLPKIRNQKMNQILERVKTLWTDNPALKEKIYNIIVDFENKKPFGVFGLLNLLTESFSNIKYKIMLRNLLVYIIKIYNVTKQDIVDEFDKSFFEKGKIPKKPESKDEDSDYWDYTKGVKREHPLTLNQIYKILGV